MVKISLIAAISENKVIGRDNDLPWHIPEDLKRFKEITQGHPVIMGRKTYESIGRLLPNRTNIIITRDKDYKVEGAVIVQSLDEAIKRAELSIQDSRFKNLGVQPRTNNQELTTDKAPLRQGYEGQGEIFIIGGGQIFEQAMEVADKLYLTVVHTTLDGDVFFPNYSGFTKETYRRDSANEKYSYTFLDLEK